MLTSSEYVKMMEKKERKKEEAELKERQTHERERNRQEREALMLMAKNGSQDGTDTVQTRKATAGKYIQCHVRGTKFHCFK